MSESGEITLVEVPPLLVAGIRRKGSYEKIPLMIGELAEFIVRKEIGPAGPPIFLLHEKSAEDASRANAAGEADLEVAFPVTGRTRAEGGISTYELPGGMMARVLHKGPYQEVGPAYEKLFAWLESEGRKVAGPLREIYLNDPRQVSPDEILTEILAPVN
jgi:AraC family transcriptional regulator